MLHIRMRLAEYAAHNSFEIPFHRALPHGIIAFILCYCEKKNRQAYVYLQRAFPPRMYLP